MKQRLSTIGQSEGVFCEQTGIQLAHSRVPHLPIPAGWRNASKHCDSVHPSDVCYKFHGKSSSVGGSPSRAEWEHRILGPHFGRSTSSQHILGGRQLSHLLDWLDPLWVLHRSGWKKHTIVLTFKFA